MQKHNTKSKIQNTKSKIQNFIFFTLPFAFCSLPFPRYLLPFAVCLLPLAFFAQTNPTIIQQHIYGGSASERLYAIQQTLDGGFIASGNTNSYIGDRDIDDVVRRQLGQIAVDANNDLWVIKLDANYKIQWQRVFGGNGFDGGLAIKQTSDGSYIVAGYLSSSGGDNSGVHPSHNGGTTRDALVCKLNSDGSTAWIKLMGGGGDDQFEKIQITPDGGILLCGFTNSNDGDVPANLYHDNPFNDVYGDAWLVKLDANGNLLWQRVIGGENKDAFTGMDKAPDGNYILGGFTNSNLGDLKGVQFGYDRKAWIVKVTPEGKILWQNVAGKVNNNIETRPYSIITSQAGDFYLGGVTAQDSASTMDFFLVKFNSNGEYKWARTYGGSGDDWARSLAHSTPDDGIFITGYTLTNNNGDVSGFHNEHDAWILHCDSTGNILQKIIAGGSDYDYFWNTCNTSDGRAIFAGYSKSRDFDLAGIPKRGDLDGWIVEFDWGKYTPPVCIDTQRVTLNVCQQNQVFTDTARFKRSDGCISVVITQRIVSNAKNIYKISDIVCNPSSDRTSDTLNLKSSGGCDSTIIITHTIKRTGAACDDGNPATVNDILQTDCSCKGEKNPNSPTDLSVSVSASPNSYKNWTVNIFTTVVKNIGLTDFTDIVVSIPYPKAAVDGGPSKVSNGLWLEYCSAMQCYEWRIPLLKSGDSAVYAQPLFVLAPDGKLEVTATLKSSTPEDLFSDNNTSKVTLLPASSFQSSAFSYQTTSITTHHSPLINIYPQPTNGLFYLGMNTEINETIEFSCVNAMGRIIWSETKISPSNDAVFEFNLSNTSNGLYFLRAHRKDGSILMKKIIKN